MQMKKFYKKVFVSLILLGLLGFASNSLALELDWPNSPRGTKLTDNSGLKELVQYIYEWAIALGGLAAFIALIRAGFDYLTSAGNSTKMSDARKDINSALLGLVLLLSSFLVLNLINPELTTLKMPTIEPFGQECRDCIEKWGENEWQKKCIDQCDLIKTNTFDPLKSCDQVIFYAKENYEPEDRPALTINMSDYDSGDCKQISPPIYQGTGSIKIEGGNCLIELYDKTTCDGDPMATINYSVQDLSQLYLKNDIRRVQVKK